MPRPDCLSFRPVLFIALGLAAVLPGCASTPATPPAPPAPSPSASSSATAQATVPGLPAPALAPATAQPVPAAAAAAAGDEAALAQGFTRWVADFRAQARAQGIGDATLADAFDNVQYLPRVIELDRAQPEFTRNVWDYLDTAVSAQRVARGLGKLEEVRAAVDAASARYGVPPHVIVAIWGMESSYGLNYGNIATIDALATLGFEGRRQGFAQSELMAALRIIQSGDIDHARMIGSWAGAMGQTQFLPSSFLAYAVDADGDGRRDIWGSMADVTASTANFLARSGWQADQTWGTEVRLPAGFDFGRADASVRRSSADWAAEGVQSMDGSPLPRFADGSVLLSAGATGPAFLVGPNFRAILRYNNSTSYALAVGLLAQRLAGGPGVQAPWPRELTALTRSELTELQTALNQRGFAAGTPDGMMGPATRDGLRRWQRSAGLPADGYPSSVVLERLRAAP